MGLQGMNGAVSQVIDCFQILFEHVGMLVIFGRDVLFDSIAERNIMCTAKRQLHEVTGVVQCLIYCVLDWFFVTYEAIVDGGQPTMRQGVSGEYGASQNTTVQLVAEATSEFVFDPRHVQ